MMNFSKFPLYETRSSTNLRQTVSAIDMVDGASYNLGLCISKNMVDGICDVAGLWTHENENEYETVFAH